jgi:hypothetical protein
VTVNFATLQTFLSTVRKYGFRIHTANDRETTETNALNLAQHLMPDATNCDRLRFIDNLLSHVVLDERVTAKPEDLEKSEAAREMIDRMTTEGFTLIRNLLEGRVKGGANSAHQLAEALHNLPLEQNNDFRTQLVCGSLQKFINAHPWLDPHLRWCKVFVNTYYHPKKDDQ